MTINISSKGAKLTLLFSLFLSVNIYAQNYIGLSGRIGLHKVSNNSEAEFSLKPGVGLDYLHQFENHLRFTTGAYFSPLGFKETFITTDNIGQPTGTISLNYNLNYLSVPLLVGYTFGFENLNLYANVGAVPAYLLNVSYKVNEEKFTPSFDEFTTIDLSAMLNVGAEFVLGEKFRLNTDLNMNKGFISVSDAIYSSYKESKNIGLFMSLGLKYRL